MTSDKRSVQYAYDAFGRLVSATDGAGRAETFARDALGRATNETQTVFDELFWTNRTAVLDRPLDAFGRPAGLVVKIDGDFAQSVCYTYGMDGRVDTGERNQTWDAAGRLVKSSPDLVQRWQTWQDFDYDYRGRRTAKYTQIFFGGIAPPVDTHLYFYDDWNLVHETTISDTYQIKHVDYFWGPDLSGTLQGAGGVGGLVAVSIDGDYYFPGYDNNGNVIGYWDESGSLVAEYAYDAFGNTISSSGSMASVFPHRFSTKYYDAETDLYYYGYRYYAPSLGRWISRDPIGETGGNNLLVFCENNPFSKVDPTGEKVIVLLAVDEAFSEATLSLEIDVANEIKKWRKEFKNFRFRVALLHRNRFQELVKAGCVTFDGKPFNGSRDEYLSLIDNELRSTIVRLDPDENTMDNFGELVRKAVEYPSYLHDRLVIVTHGTGFGDEVWFASTTTERGRFEELVDRNMRPHFQGQLVFVFCYRTGIGAEHTEGFWVIGSKPVPSSDSPKRPITRLSFYSFSFYHGIGTGPAQRE